MKAERNKTIDLPIEEGQKNLERSIKIKKKPEAESLIDKTICGDTFAVLEKMPEKFVDLLIVDPPYNLDKNFHGNKFKKTTDEIYEEYTEKWVEAVKPLLKDDASIYVCCDWLSGSAISRVLSKHFILQNRIFTH